MGTVRYLRALFPDGLSRDEIHLVRIHMLRSLLQSLFSIRDALFSINCHERCATLSKLRLVHKVSFTGFTPGQYRQDFCQRKSPFPFHYSCASNHMCTLS